MEALRCNAELLKHDYRACLVGFLFVCNVLLQSLQISLGVFAEILAAFDLSLLLEFLVLKLGKVAGILEDLDERLLLQCFLLGLLDGPDGFKSLFKEFFLRNVR